MSWDSKDLELFGWEGNHGLTDLSHLVLSSVLSRAEVGVDFNPWDCDILGMTMQLPVGKLHMWVLRTVPSLPDCFTQFVHRRIQKCITLENKSDPSCSFVHDPSAIVDPNTTHLTKGRVWAISLTMRSTLREEILKVYYSYNECMHPQTQYNIDIPL